MNVMPALKHLTIKIYKIILLSFSYLFTGINISNLFMHSLLKHDDENSFSIAKY